MRSSVLSSLACMAVLALPGLAQANVGVAFVHGTGKQTNALADYWTAPFVDSVRQGLPNPANYVVINCDFEQYMWDPEAAGCLAARSQRRTTPSLPAEASRAPSGWNATHHVSRVSS